MADNDTDKGDYTAQLLIQRVSLSLIKIHSCI